MKKKSVFTSALALGIACTTAISSSIVMPAGAIADDVTIDSTIVYVYGCDTGDILESYAIDGTVFDRVTVTENMLDSDGYAKINSPETYRCTDVSAKYPFYNTVACIKNITKGTTRYLDRKSTVTFSNLKADAVVCTDDFISDYDDVKAVDRLEPIDSYNESVNNYDGSYPMDYYVTYVNSEAEEIIDQRHIITSPLGSNEKLLSFDSFGTGSDVEDVTLDGKVNVEDVLFLKNWLLGKEKMKPDQFVYFIKPTGCYVDQTSDYFDARIFKFYAGHTLNNYTHSDKDITLTPVDDSDVISTVPDFNPGEEIESGFYLPEVHVEEGGEFELKVLVKNFYLGTPGVGYDFQISYDPEVMTFEEGDLSNLITDVGDGYNDIHSAYSIDNEKGIFTCYDSTRLNCADGNEDGVLLTLKGTLKDSAKFGDIIPISIGPVERDFNFISLGSRNYFQSGYVVVDKSSSSTHITKIKGDVNFDGDVTVADAVAISSYVGNPELNSLDAYAISNGDVHNVGDGLSANDALMIQQYLVGVIDTLDVE